MRATIRAATNRLRVSVEKAEITLEVIGPRGGAGSSYVMRSSSIIDEILHTWNHFQTSTLDHLSVEIHVSDKDCGVGLYLSRTRVSSIPLPRHFALTLRGPRSGRRSNLRFMEAEQEELISVLREASEAAFGSARAVSVTSELLNSNV